MKLSELGSGPRERIIRGKGSWWFLGPGGVARLKDKHLSSDGTLRPAAERYLREQGLFAARHSRVYSLTVLTSTDCNLGCGYCFQNTSQDPTGGNRPPRIAHSRLTSQTITSILEFTERQMAAVEFTKLHVLLFGGEPLLNPRGCLELLTRAADYGMISASMITNATLLTPALASKLAGAGLGVVQVTFDGDRETHDLIRIRRSGGGSFDAIIANMARASDVAPFSWNLRVNVSHHNWAGVDDLIENLAGKLDSSRCSIHFARVGDVGVGYGNELGHTEFMAARFSGWQRRALELGFQVSRPGSHVPCVTCSFKDGKFGAVVNADGTLSSCWETAGQPGWEVGTAEAGYLPAERTEGKWVSCEDHYRYFDEEATLASFRDAIDAALLDYLDETGRL